MSAETSFTAKDIFRLMQDAALAWYNDDAPSKGAAIAYYTVFSVAPLLIIAIAIAGYFFGAEAASGRVFEQLRALVGEDGAKALQSIVLDGSHPTKGILASIVGLVVLMVGATGVFVELQNTLDRIWKVPVSRYEASWWYIIRRRILIFGMMLAAAFLLLVSLVVSAAIQLLQSLWQPYVGWPGMAVTVMNSIGSLLIVTVLFAAIFRFLPRVSVAWRDVIIGALVTAVLFEIGEWLIGVYMRESGAGSGFGVAGALVVMLLWVYYSAQIFLFGAELTWVYAERCGSRAARDPVG